MAVHEPRAGIIGLERDDHVALVWKQNDISPRRVVKLEVQFVGKCGVLDLLQNGEVVAVKVNLM